MAVYYDDPFALAGREQNRDWWNTGTSSGSSNSFATSAARENVNALPDIAQITQLINSINQTAQQASNAGRIPGGRGLESQSSGNIGQALRGQLPQDVINLIGQQAAERGAMTGSPMGPGSNASFLRSLGRTSLDMMGTGQNWLSEANARNPGAPLFDPSSMFITPGQFGGLEMERLRLPRSGGSTGPTGGYPTTMGTSSGGMGTGVNWADLFGGGDFSSPSPWSPITGNTLGWSGQGGGGNIVMSGSNPTGYYNPATNTTDQFPDYFGDF